MRGRKLRSAIVSLLLATVPPAALSREIHLDCARPHRSVAIDVDTSRLFVQLIWGEGIAEEYQNGESYMSGPSASGATQRVTFAVSVDNDSVSFGQDRICVAAGKCKEEHIRNLLDASTGTLKYDDGGVVEILKCAPAPAGRRF